MRALLEQLKEQDIPYRIDISAKTLSTFRIGGTVMLVIEPRCEWELQSAVRLCHAHGILYEILGNGSNVLFDDGYLELAVIRTTHLNAVRVMPDGIYAGCGVSLPRLCMLAASRGLGGLQFFCGIPGTLGGALAMNAGAHGRQISELIDRVKILDLKTITTRTDNCFKKNAFYRNCGYRQESTLFLGAELTLSTSVCATHLAVEMQRLKKERMHSQPLDMPSAGCVFKRPEPTWPIGKLLDELGCKGMREGGAVVSQKHAAFILNAGNASAADVKCLMKKIQEKAKKERGIILESELRIISNGT